MDLFFFSSSFSLITSSVLYAALPRFQRAAFRGISSSRFFPASIKRSRTLGMVRVFFFFLSLVLQFSFFLSCFLPFLSLYFTDSKRLRQYYYCYFLLSYLTLWLYEAEYKEPLSLQEHRISSIP